jgi:signal transduction histidine kinase
MHARCHANENGEVKQMTSRRGGATSGSASGAARTKRSRPLHKHLVLAEMLGMLSHEMRTPLQTLSACLDTVEFELGDIQSPVVRAQFGRMRSALDKATMRLDLLSDYARTADRLSNQAARIEDVALQPFLEDVVRESLAADARRVIVEIADDIPASLPVDKPRLQQVIENYLKNASKYCPTGDVRLKVRWAGSTGQERRSGSIEFAVIDQYGGVADDEVDLIWQPFYRTRSAQGKPGSGLGLAIVRVLCENAGWRAGYRRADGLGSCFYVCVPTSLPVGSRPNAARRSRPAR